MSSELAIIGYACRLPHAGSVEGFWNLLAQGRSAVDTVSPDRWIARRTFHPNRPIAGKSYTFAAGQIDDVFGFDAEFFGISPREAVQMDPQQRLLLQVVWEALENSGVPPSRLAGTPTGVFVGASTSDYSNNFLLDAAAIDAQMMTGNTLSIISNRISYALDLAGPSLTIDTACSSSLVALSAAADAMTIGQIDTAIVGGVNLLLSPFPFVGFSRATMLSPTGACRAFSADADGYVRSEGAVVFVLRTLKAAREAGNNILGVISGWGVNSDGRTNGLSLPSSKRQADLLAQIYDRLAITPDDIGFIEAHGTGTRVGDPAEANALGTILGQRRTSPLKIGSVKTNFGHLEAASGLTGLLKAQLALERGIIPASLHCERLNPDIDFANLNLTVNAQVCDLKPRALPWYAGVNSFGFGGTNAHIVLRQPTAQERLPTNAEQVPLSPPTIILSAASRPALAAVANDFAKTAIGTSRRELSYLASAANYHRDRLEHRLVIDAENEDELREALDAAANDIPHPAIEQGRAARGTRPVGFVFSGNGSQWAGMARNVLATDVTFRAAFEDIDARLAKYSRWSLNEMLQRDDLETELKRTEIAQPLLFAIQVALVQSLAEFGVTPAAVAGHSVGEIAAAWSAGLIDLDAAVYLVHSRSRHQARLRGVGSMAALLTSAEDAARLIVEEGVEAVEVAGVNSPRSVTLAGPASSLATLALAARRRRIAYRRLALDYPFHSSLIEPIKSGVLADLAGQHACAGRLPFISTVTGDIMTGVDLNGDYWWRNVREPVMFAAAIESMARLGVGVFLEIGPRPVLRSYISDTLGAAGVSSIALASLEQETNGQESVRRIAVRVAAAGGQIAEQPLFGLDFGHSQKLPNYPWQNAFYRIEPTTEAVDLFGRGSDHPLLGNRPVADAPFHAAIDPTWPAYLEDHKVENTTLFPAAGFIELGFAAARAHGQEGSLEITDLEILQPLLLDSRTTELRTSLLPDGGLEICSRPRLSEELFSPHARGRVLPIESNPSTVDLAPLLHGRRLNAEQLYAIASRFGLDYGPAFRLAQSVMATDGTILVRIAEAPDADHILHPAVMDAAFHGLFALLSNLGTGGVAFLPVQFGRIRLFGPTSAIRQAHLTIVRRSKRSVVADTMLLDSENRVLVEVKGARFKAVALTRERVEPAFYTQRLRRLPSLSHQSSREPNETIISRLNNLSNPEIELDAGALLVDAAARRLAWDALQRYANAVNVIDLQQTTFAPSGIALSAVPLFHRLKEALIEDGAASEIEGQISLVEQCPYDELSELVLALAAEAPERAGELTALAFCSDAIESALSNGLAPESAPIATHLLKQLASTGPGPNALAKLGLWLVERLTEHSAPNRPLSLLLIGGASEQLARLLHGSSAIAALAVTDFDPVRAEQLVRSASHETNVQFGAIDDIASVGPFDAVLLFPSGPAPTTSDLARLNTLSHPGGLLAVLSSKPVLFDDILHGLGADWWDASLDPVFPIGGTLSQADWTSALEISGFSQICSTAITLPALEAFVVIAEASETTQVEATNVGAVLVFGEEEQATTTLAEVLRARGRVVDTHIWDFSSLTFQSDAPLPQDFVLLMPNGGEPAETILANAQSLKQLITALDGKRSRIWVRLDGGAPDRTSTPNPQPASAALWGMVRVLMNEVADIDWRLIDAADMDANAVADEILSPSVERELVIRKEGRFGVRVGPTAPPALLKQRTIRQLSQRQQGSLDTLIWEHVTPPDLAPDSVEIEVAAVGLNFRDVMWALGLLPDEVLEDGYAGATLGMECAGIVTRIGDAITRFSVGDRVMAFAPSSFASHAYVPEASIMRLPDGMAFEAGATVPVTFLTAWYALVQLADLRAGESILIHGGAGGVGLAALQIARARGARVFATAGSAAKRRLLTLLGAEAVFDSRSLSFADGVTSLARDGVDVVLNSLAGEAMERSIACLKPFGRFIELGKRDYVAGTRVGLRPFRRNLSYFGVDADQLLAGRSELTSRLLADIAEAFASGDLTPLPYRAFSSEHVTDAFRLMQQSGHIGKVVVAPAPVAAVTTGDPVKIHAEATYLVIGGLGGFGLATAAFLAERGARSIVLTSRSGRASSEAAARIAELEAKGVRIHLRATDAADEAAVDRLLEEIDESMPSLRGVIHAAMILEDGLFANLSSEHISMVLKPKVTGAALLDKKTRRAEIDLFLLFSSATTLIGNPGQASYVAANAYLESLAAARRAQGFFALAVSWGAISDVGYLARNAKVQEILGQRLGHDSMTANEALTALGDLLDAGLPDSSISFGRINWAAARRELPIASTPLFADLMRGYGQDETENLGGQDFVAAIREATPEGARALIAEILTDEITRILRLPAGSLDVERPLNVIGMDSLMALELRLAAEQKLGIEIPLMALAGGTSVIDIARRIASRIRDDMAPTSDDRTVLASGHVGADTAEALGEVLKKNNHPRRRLTL